MDWLKIYQNDLDEGSGEQAKMDIKSEVREERVSSFRLK